MGAVGCAGRVCCRGCGLGARNLPFGEGMGMRWAMLAAALALAACETTGGGSAQQMDPNTRMMMFMYGMQQLQQSMQPPPAAPAMGVQCYGGQGYMWCQ